VKKCISIIEDDFSIAENIRLFLEARSDHQVVRHHDSMESFLAEVDFYQKPDIILLDIGLPGMSGVKGIPLIKEKLTEVDIIMLTTYEEEEIIFEALSSGASAYISKKTSLAKIIDAINVVANGGSYMSPLIAKKVIAKLAATPKKEKISLSDRHKEIVKLISEGKATKEIAAACSITVNTVKTHIKKIYQILEVNNRVTLSQKYRDGEIG